MEEGTEREGPSCRANTWRERAEFEEVVRAHGSALLARAKRLTHGHADAWDLLQDTLERALTRRPEGLPAVKLRPWLMSILGNLHTDRCRAGRRHKRVTLGDNALLDVVASDPLNEPAWLSIDAVSIRACLERLDPRLREAYALQVEQGLSVIATAARLGVPPATAGTRVYRARRRLRELLSNPELQ